MKKGDVVMVFCNHDNLGKPWAHGGPGVSSAAVPSKQRWFPDGTCGLFLGKTYPDASNWNNFARSLCEVMVDNEVHTFTVQNLRAVQ